MPQIQLQGRSFVYDVRVSRRAKHISVRCSDRRGLEVVYPPGPQKPPPEELLKQQCAWVIASMEKLHARRASLPGREYVDGETFLFRGRPHILRTVNDPAVPRITIRREGGVLRLTYPAIAHLARKAMFREAVIGFYRERADSYLPARARHLSRRLGFEFARLRIKNQKTRWGSCSAKGNINLNLRLLMAPDEAIEYVIIHELCHLKIMSHSAAFWNLVESHCPDYRHWRSWFKQHGPSLIL